MGMATLPCGSGSALLPSDPNLALPHHKFTLFPTSKFSFRPSTPKTRAFRAQKHPSNATKTKTIHCYNLSWKNGIKVEVAQCLPNSDSTVSNSRPIQAQPLKLNAFKTNGIVSNNGESLDNAGKMFERIPNRTLPTYASLIASHCRLRQWEKLFTVFGSMIDEGILPDIYLVPTILKACSSTQMLRGGKMIHGYVLRKGMESDVFIGNALIDFYSNCGDLTSSVDVFGTMKERDVVSWTALVSAYMDEGLLDEAMDIFNSMQLNGVKPDLIFWNALISGFARNGEIALALQSLEDMQEKGLKPHANCWNGIISGCVQNGFFEDALDVLHDMLCFPEVPNSVTIASILPACAGLKDLDLGRAVHGYAIKHGHGGNCHVEGSLIGMYSKCQRIDYAEKVFCEAENKNTSVWNEMIAAYADEGKVKKAKELLRLMQNEGLNPDMITYNILLAGHVRYRQKNEVYELLSEMVQMGLKPLIITWNVLISGFQQSGLSYEALKIFQNLQSYTSSRISRGSAQTNATTIASALAACADLNLWCQGKEIHGYTLRNGFESNIYVSSALVDMYMKGKDTESATKIFSRTVDRNTISWNNMISGYVRNKQLEMALNLFYKMLVEGHKPSSITFLILLPACSKLAAVRLGRQLHAYIAKSQFQELKNNLAGALVDMYAMSGCIVEAKVVYDLR